MPTTERKALGPFEHDPNGISTFYVNWETRFGVVADLHPVADPLASAVWVVPTGLTKVSESRTSYKHYVTVSGGTAGVKYRATSRATTTSGEVDDQSVDIRVIEK